MFSIHKNTSGWDLKNELSKVTVRWLLLISTSPYLIYITKNQGAVYGGIGGTANLTYIYSLAGTIFTFNLVYNLFLHRCRKKEVAIHPGWKYLTMTIDLLTVSLILLPTGGSESIFFLLYIVIILSNGMRFGMRLAMLGILIFNLFYVVVLLLQYYPRLTIPAFQSEALKVIGIWIVGLYIGYLSRHFELLYDEVEVYKKMLKTYVAAELKEQPDPANKPSGENKSNG